METVKQAGKPNSSFLKLAQKDALVFGRKHFGRSIQSPDAETHIQQYTTHHRKACDRKKKMKPLEDPKGYNIRLFVSVNEMASNQSPPLSLLSGPRFVFTHHTNDLCTSLLHTCELLFLLATSLFMCCEPVLTCTVFFFRVCMGDHARVHGQTLRATDPCCGDGSVDGAFGKCCGLTLVHCLSCVYMKVIFGRV